MSETESFEQAMEIARHVMCEECELIDDYGSLCQAHDDSCLDCEKSMVARLKAAHNREIRDLSRQQYDRGFRDGTQQEYHRGFEDGRHSMDAEHRAVAMRLRGLRFDGGSHENLARIAYAIYPCATGWTCESAAGLRDKLVDLMGGVSDDGCCCAGGGACNADCGDGFREQTEVNDGRTADDCGADTDCGDGGGDLHMAGVTNDDTTSSITDELREFKGHINAGLTPEMVLALRAEINCIADRIDEQFDRICQQQEAVLQSTIDGAAQRLKDADKRLDDAAHDVEMWRERAEDIHANFSRALTSRNAELGCCNLHVNQLEAERADLLDLLRDAAKEYVTTQAVCDELRYQREELMGKWIRERAKRQELQARLNKANGENKGLRLSIDEQKESIAQRKKTIKKLTRDNEKVWNTVHGLQAKLDSIRNTLDG